MLVRAFKLWYLQRFVNFYFRGKKMFKSYLSLITLWFSCKNLKATSIPTVLPV